MYENPADFYLNRTEPQKSTLLALRSMIFDFDENITETIKYGMPCFLYKRNIFCYLWMDQQTGEPYILLAEGNHLTHPCLERGNRRRMKIFRIDPKDDLPVGKIEAILKESVDLYRNGIVKLK